MPSRKPAGGNRSFSYILPFGKFAVVAGAMLLSFSVNSFAQVNGICVRNCPKSGGWDNRGNRGNRGGGPIIPKKTPAQIRQEKIAALLMKAQQAQRNGRLKQAVEFFYAAHQLDPKNRKLLARYRRAVSSWKYSEGVNQFGRGNADRAYALLKEALRYRSDRQGREDIRRYMRRKVYPRTKKGKIEAFYKEQARKKAIEKKAKGEMSSQVDSLAAKLEGRGPKNSSSALREISSAGGGAKGGALEQLEIAERQGRKGTKSAVGVPFDSGPPVEAGSGIALGKIPPIGKAGPVAMARLAKKMNRRRLAVEVRAREKRIKSLEALARKKKAPGEKSKLFEEQIRAMAEQSVLLDESINKEKNPVKRAGLISAKTSLESAKQVKEIEIMDLSIKGPGN